MKASRVDKQYIIVYNYKWKYVGMILEVYLPRVLYAKSNLATCSPFFWPFKSNLAKFLIGEVPTV